MTQRQELITRVAIHLEKCGVKPRTCTEMRIEEAIEQLQMTQWSDNYHWIRLRNAVARKFFDRYFRKHRDFELKLTDIPFIQ